MMDDQDKALYKKPLIHENWLWAELVMKTFLNCHKLQKNDSIG